MAIRVRAFLGLVMVVSTTWLATSCGHYTCGATFGNSNCSSSGGGIGGGGGNNNAQQALRYAMDSSAGGLGLEGLNINSSGTFAPVPGFVSPSLPIAPVGIGGMVIVNKKFLYLAFSNGELDAFSIDPSNGNLTAIGTSPYTTLGGSSLVADPLNRFLFVGDPSGISVFTINADGSLPTTALSHTATTEPSEMVTDGTGKYLYAIDGTNINAFAYNQSTGGLTSLGSFAVGMGMANISGETTGKFILGVTGLTGGSGTTDAHIYVFAITQSGTTAGALTQVVSSPFATVNPPSQVIVSPNGKFVYAFTETVNVTATFDPIEGYSIDTNGNLTALSGSPFTSLAGEVGMFDQSGQYLFMAGTDQSTSITSSIALNASSTTGALASNLAHAGLVSVHFVVTDEP